MLKELKDHLESSVYFATLCIIVGSVFGNFLLFAYVKGWSGGFVTVSMLSSASILGAAYMVVVGLLLSCLATASLHGENFHKAMAPHQGARKEITSLGVLMLTTIYLILFSLWEFLMYYLGMIQWSVCVVTLIAAAFTVIYGVMLYKSNSNSGGFGNITKALAHVLVDGFVYIAPWLLLVYIFLYAMLAIFRANQLVSELTIQVLIVSLAILLHFSLFYFGRVKYPFAYGCVFLLVLVFAVTVNGISKTVDVLVSVLRLGNYAAVLELDAGAFQLAPEELGFYGGKQATRELCVLLNFGDMIFVQSAPERNWVPPVIALKADKVVAIKPIESVDACAIRKNNK